MLQAAAEDTTTIVPDLTTRTLDTTDIIPTRGTKILEGSIPIPASTTPIQIQGIRIRDTQPEMEDMGALEVCEAII